MSDKGAPRKAKTHSFSPNSKPARRSADLWANTYVVTSISWCLQNPHLTRPRFTAFQWSVLVASYMERDGYGWVIRLQPRGRACRRLNEPYKRVGPARDAAKEIAYELYYSWRSARAIADAKRKKRAGLRLTQREERFAAQRLDPWQRALLRKHSLEKKGKRDAPSIDWNDPYRDALDGPHGSTQWREREDPGAEERLLHEAGGLYDEPEG